MKINNDDPLPRHTQYNCEECYAKVILEEFAKDKVGNLKLKDKPDLQNDDLDVGIECTIAIDKRYIETENLYCELINKKSKNSEKCKERIKMLGGKITDYFLIQSGSGAMDNIIRVVNKKIKKLNSKNYKIFKNNYLLIRDCIYITSEHIKSLQCLLVKMNNKYEKNFDIIYILLNNKLIELDMIEHTNYYFEISRNMQYELAQRARKMVIEKEENLEEDDYYSEDDE